MIAFLLWCFLFFLLACRAAGADPLPDLSGCCCSFPHRRIAVQRRTCACLAAVLLPARLLSAPFRLSRV